jgi:hypothetical protein
MARQSYASGSHVALIGAHGASLNVSAATLAEIADQLCEDGGLLLQATQWAVNKRACAGGACACGGSSV